MALEPVDMRGSFDALAGHVRRLQEDPLDGHLYLFVNKRPTRVTLCVASSDFGEFQNGRSLVVEVLGSPLYNSLYACEDHLVVKGALGDLPWCEWSHLLSWQDSLVDELLDGAHANAQPHGCFVPCDHRRAHVARIPW
ncbi:MAG: transposase [Myxococcales bacterium]|nr:transposase [Myxococcales bacterium]